ncbi:MAG: Panacea domain-containing protein [Bacteroidia bacterium]
MENTTNIRDEDLILYIASKLKNCESFGSIMLNKVLYYSDNIHYIKFGRAISSFRYINQDFGPTPQPSTFLPLRQKLIREGRIKEEIKEGIVRSRKKIVALKQGSTTLFNKEELKIVDEVIESFRNVTAIELSDRSHNELGWQLTERGEEIPLYAFLFSIPELSDADYSWATDELTKLKINCA